MKVLVLTCVNKYKYHNALAKDIMSALTSQSSEMNAVSYDMSINIPTYEHYGKISVINPDLMITLDCSGFDIITSGDTLGFNGFSFRIINMLFGPVYKYSEELMLRQNMSMVTCVSCETDISSLNLRENVPNIINLCDVDYRADSDEGHERNISSFIEWFDKTDILSEAFRPENKGVYSQKSDSKRILIFEWGMGSLTHKDIRAAFERSSYECNVLSYQFRDVNSDDYFEEMFLREIKNNTYNFVYSTNYFPLVAKCCNEADIIYVSWSYDAPLNVPDIEKTLGLLNNRVFLYDRAQVNEYVNKGFNNVYHLPLAVNTERLDRITLTSRKKERYASDISFVGQLYKSELSYIKSGLDEYECGFIDAVIRAQSKIYGYYLIDDVLNEETMKRINSHKISVSKEALAYAMSAQITRDERLIILKLLSNHYGVKIYSSENNQLLDKAEFMGTVGYMNEMPMVFKSSKINLNISLKCIRSGVPLRCLDIMGAGGFLVSNYQPELAEFFINDEEVVMYDSIEDMYEKVKFYLDNDELRTRIALNGYNRVKTDFTYEKRIAEILKTI